MNNYDELIASLRVWQGEAAVSKDCADAADALQALQAEVDRRMGIGGELISARREPEEASVWCRYVAGMVATYLKVEDDKTDAIAGIIERRLKFLQASQPSQAREPDMFWNHDDAEKLYGSIDEFLNDEICNGGFPLEVGNVRTVQRAIRLPNIDIRITAVDDEECEAEYEVIEAINAKGAA